MPNWAWFVLGVAVAWLPILFGAALVWIMNHNAAREDEYWREKMKPFRGE